MRDSRESLPIPDPTELTTSQLLRELSLLKELVETKLSSLQEVTNEKFTSIATQFRDNKTAVDAAFQAAAGSITKSDTAFTKQIDQIGALITATKDGTDGKINDLKERLTTIESLSKGHNEVWGYLAVAGGLVLTAVALFLKH